MIPYFYDTACFIIIGQVSLVNTQNDYGTGLCVLFL